ncbi:MAG: HEPN domain-containing protein [Chloroflexi bacterium]|nr:HEPN domain-containing protein [Chloroflexota bacterium]
MNSHDDPLYRLKLAKRSLAKAENDAVDGQWDDCLAEAQEAVENAGKAILGHFRPIPKTHDVIGPLKRLTDKGNLPDAIRQDIEASLDAFRNMGLATHIRAAYGDELTGTVPWELIQEPEATAGLEKRGAPLRWPNQFMPQLVVSLPQSSLKPHNRQRMTNEARSI